MREWQPEQVDDSVEGCTVTTNNWRCEKDSKQENTIKQNHKKLQEQQPLVGRPLKTHWAGPKKTQCTRKTKLVANQMG